MPAEFQFRHNQAKICSWKRIELISAALKGQIISKGLFGILGFFQKTNKQICFITVREKKRIRSFVFWKNLRLPKVVSKLADL